MQTEARISMRWMKSAYPFVPPKHDKPHTELPQKKSQSQCGTKEPGKDESNVLSIFRGWAGLCAGGKKNAGEISRPDDGLVLEAYTSLLRLRFIMPTQAADVFASVVFTRTCGFASVFLASSVKPDVFLQHTVPHLGDRITELWLYCKMFGTIRREWIFEHFLPGG